MVRTQFITLADVPRISEYLDPFTCLYISRWMNYLWKDRPMVMIERGNERWHVDEYTWTVHRYIEYGHAHGPSFFWRRLYTRKS